MRDDYYFRYDCIKTVLPLKANSPTAVVGQAQANHTGIFAVLLFFDKYGIFYDEAIPDRLFEARLGGDDRAARLPRKNGFLQKKTSFLSIYKVSCSETETRYIPLDHKLGFL